MRPISIETRDGFFTVTLCVDSEAGLVCASHSIECSPFQKQILDMLRARGADDEDVFFHGGPVVRYCLFKTAKSAAERKLREALENVDRPVRYVVAGANDDQLRKIKMGADMAADVIAAIYPGIGAAMKQVVAVESGDPQAINSTKQTFDAAAMGNQKAMADRDALIRANAEIDVLTKLLGKDAAYSPQASAPPTTRGAKKEAKKEASADGGGTSYYQLGIDG